MTLILSGTDGLSDVDGSAATPAIRGTDANTGIFFPAADTIAFAEGGAEAMRITSTGDVGIATTTPDIIGYGAGNTTLGTKASATFYPNIQIGTVGVAAAITTILGDYNFYGLNGGSSVVARSLIRSRLDGATDATNISFINYIGGVGTERARLNSTGAFVLSGGTGTANGVGITFPATQSASSDANTLDDYEEGTWTPSVGGNATYTTQSGTYTKVGNIVTAWFDIQINVLGTGGTGNIQGLPYVSRISPSNPQGMAGMVGYFVNIATASTLILVRVDNNTTTASLSNTAGVTTNVLGNAIYGNSARTTGTIIYQANA